MIEVENLSKRYGDKLAVDGLNFVVQPGIVTRPAHYLNIPDPAAHEAMIRAGLPPWLADQLLILWAQLRRGAAATTTDVVRVLTGREPLTVTDFGRDHADIFRS